MTTLTFDDLSRDLCRIKKDLNMFSYYSSCALIKPGHYWPRVEDGVETLRFEAHPFIKWLARRLPVTPYVEMEVTKYRDADPIFDTRSSAIYCSHAQADVLRQVGVS